MAHSEFTTEREHIEQWADEHHVVPVRGDDRIEFVPEDEVAPDQERLDWETFHRTVDEHDRVVIRYGEASDRDVLEVTDRESALVTLEEEYDREEIEQRLIDGETITGTVTETTQVETTIVEEATLESEVVDREVVDRHVASAELLDRRCDSCDITDRTGQADSNDTYDFDRFLVADSDVTTGKVEQYDEYPFGITVEVDEDWSVTIEERERFTVETRITDIDVAEAETVDAHDLEADVDIDAVHERLLGSDLIDVGVEKTDVVDAETYDIESEFTEDESITTYLTARNTFDREIAERRRLMTEVVEGELLARNTRSETLRESRLAQREGTARTEESERSEDIDETEGEFRTIPDADDAGKPVVVPTGDEIGMVTAVERGVAYVDPHPGITEKISAKLGWSDIDEDDVPLDEDHIVRITSDAVRLSGDYDVEALENVDTPE
jgi:hypothetical protein